MNHGMLKLEGHWCPIMYKEHLHTGSGPPYRIDVEKRDVRARHSIHLSMVYNLNEEFGG